MSNHINHRRSAEHQRRVEDTRRSNATTKHKSVKDASRSMLRRGGASNGFTRRSWLQADD
jgi:hypothetical protein